MNINLYYDNTAKPIVFAASELSHYLSRVNHSFYFMHNPLSKDINTAESLSIELSIDKKNYSVTDDAYQVDISTNTGFIIGSNARSVILGVYAFLRKIGYRFILPGKTFLPESLHAEDLFVSFSKTASLRHRGICIEGANSLENVLDFIDWLPKVGYNSFFLQFKEPYIFLERWYEHVFNPYLKTTTPDKEFYQSCYKKMEEAIAKRDLLYHAVGHGWTCEAIGQPSIGWVKADAAPKDETAELLALVNGERTYIDGIPLNTNLCYSNEKAISLFCDTVISYVKEHPFANYVHIWLADEPNHICECENCRKELPTDQYVKLLNRIDEQLTAEKLDCKLVFLLYQELLYSPLKERLNNTKRFILMFAPISRTFKESYPKEITPVPLPKYQRNHMVLPVTIDENLSYLKKWRDTFTGDSLVYDYPLGRAHYGDFGYIGISKVLSGDIKNISSLGLNGYISCQELRAFLPNSFPNYLMGLLLTDTEESFDSILSEYYQAAYGDHYEKVIHYLTRVSELSDCDYFNRIGNRINPSVCARYKELLTLFESFTPYIKSVISEKTHAVSSNTELQIFFWRLLDYHAEYGVRLTKALIALSSGDHNTAQMYFLDFCRYIRSNENAFQLYLDVYRIIEVATKYTGFSLPTDIVAP